MVNVNERLEEFLDRNKGIIIKIARKYLGPYFNEKEAMSVAYLAGLQAKVYKRDQFQKTKDTTVFVWYLQKGFEGMRGFDGGEIVSNKIYPTYNEESKVMGFERTFWDSEEVERGGYGSGFNYKKYGTEPGGGEANEFYVCVQSFKDKAISKKILDTLRLLTHHCSHTPGINEIEKMYGCRKKALLSTKIIMELVSEIDSMGLKLFKAECMNGVNSTVIVCAKSKEEADIYFEKYGKIIKCSQLIMSV